MPLSRADDQYLIRVLLDDLQDLTNRKHTLAEWRHACQTRLAHVPHGVVAATSLVFASTLALTETRCLLRLELTDARVYVIERTLRDGDFLSTLKLDYGLHL
jgi:hypothetical protein